MTDPITPLFAALADRYGIASEIGSGGMATVYVAHDLKHDRKVALEDASAQAVLAHILTQDAEPLATHGPKVPACVFRKIRSDIWMAEDIIPEGR